MDEHRAILSQSCRVGGQKIANLTKTTKYAVANFRQTLLQALKIDVGQDHEDVHPNYMCRLCENALERRCRRSKTCGGGYAEPVSWVAHTRTNCTVCTRYATEAKGGRPPKRKAGHHWSGAVTGDTGDTDGHNTRRLVLASW